MISMNENENMGPIYWKLAQLVTIWQEQESSDWIGDNQTAAGLVWWNSVVLEE